MLTRRRIRAVNFNERVSKKKSVLAANHEQRGSDFSKKENKA